MTRTLGIALASLAALLAAPAIASADNMLTIANGEAKIRSDEAGLKNAYEIEERGAEIRFYEPNDLKGTTAPPECRPGQTKNNLPIEVFCPKSSITKSITVLADDAEDTVRYAVPGIASGLDGDTGADRLTSQAASDDILDGGQGNDFLDAGPNNDDVVGDAGNDELHAGDGNDHMVGGDGLDTYDAGNGDDKIDSADGVAEKIQCGAGNDTASGDQLDEFVDCETTDRRTVAPPADQPTGDDKVSPKLTAAALTSQRIKRRRIKVVATSTEKGSVKISGFLAADGINLRIGSSVQPVAVGGGGVEFTVKLTKRMIKMIRRDLKRHRKPKIRLTLSAVDEAGNTSKPRHLTIRLRR